jgi:hypothetical protein
MMTTLRSDRRTRRSAMFNLEYLDDRIVPSSVGAEAHAAFASAHVKAAEKAAVTLERHDAKLEKIEANHAAKLAKTDVAVHHVPGGPTPRPTTPIVITGGGSPESSSSASLAAAPAVAVTMNTATLSSTATPASLTLPTTATPAVTTSTQSATTSTSSNSGSSSTLPPNLSAQLQSLYTQYESFESSGGSGTFSPTGVNGLVISGTNVGINFQTSDSADFNTLLTQLQSDGLQVTSDSAAYGIIDGMVSIAQLPAVAQISSTASVTPMFQPMAG